MKTVEVWRIEDANGYGPYPGYIKGLVRSEEVLLLASDMSYAHGDMLHPAPWEDDLPSRRELWYGCPSRTKLLEWFRGFWTELQKVNHSVVKYTVPEEDVFYGMSGRQLNFRRDRATKKVMPW